MFNRRENGEVNYKTIVNEIYDWACEESSKEDGKIGVLLCEGDENSIDKAVYEVVYPDLLIVPVGGCTTVMRTLPKLKSYLATEKMRAYGIIDRDALSKAQTKALLKDKGVYTTKLPFIENIVCSPEVLWYICDYLSIDYYTFVNSVESELLKILWQKLKEALPINIGIEKNETIINLAIRASTKRKTITKQVNKESILYSYRDKVITLIVGTHIGLRGKRAYYDFIIGLIQNEYYTDSLAHAFATFLPKLDFYDLNKFLP